MYDGAVLFSFFIILDFNRLVDLQDLNVNDWNTAFYMSYSIYWIVLISIGNLRGKRWNDFYF